MVDILQIPTALRGHDAAVQLAGSPWQETNWFPASLQAVPTVLACGGRDNGSNERYQGQRLVHCTVPGRHTSEGLPPVRTPFRSDWGLGRALLEAHHAFMGGAAPNEESSCHSCIELPFMSISAGHP